MISASLDMLEESLQKKVEILTKIEDQNEKQRDVLSDSENVDEAAFDATVDAKGRLIDEINSLDDGFQSLFDRVKEEYSLRYDTAGQTLEYAFDLLEAAFGTGQEIVLFLTEINTNSYGLRFLEQYECERY